MSRFVLKNWKYLLAASGAAASFSFDREPIRLASPFKVHAAEYERRNASNAWYRSRFGKEKAKQYDDDDDDSDDDEEREIAEKLAEEEQAIEAVINTRERRFRSFASVEYNGEVFMTPIDFLESIVAERPRPRIGRRQLTADVVDSILYNTPPKHRGSKRFFRDLEDAGLISYSEYLFLWVILTKPKTQFEVAFAMFDTDGNQLVDRREFLVLGRVMSDKRMIRRQSGVTSSGKHYGLLSDLSVDEHNNTTLLLHFFGKNGRDTLNYSEFKRFMENFQNEVLEIEFTEFSRGFKTISDLDFTEILLRYTDFDRETKKSIVKRVKRTTQQSNGINLEQFKRFFEFLNNLEEFNIAMRFHQLSNQPISQAEFQRAAKISTGFELDEHIIELIFRIFDADNDQHLSYEEFMEVMKDRLSRGFQSAESLDSSNSRFEQFKKCFRKQTKSFIIDPRGWIAP